MPNLVQNRKPFLRYNTKATLKKIHEIVLSQNLKFEKIYSGLIQELDKHKIHIINEKQLSPEQTEFVQKYFHKEVRTRLMPFLIEKDSELPNLVDDAIYLAIYLEKKETQKKRFALLEIPTDILPRFIVPTGKG